MPYKHAIICHETFLGDSSGDHFYTGFSGKIDDGGIIINTVKKIEKYSTVQVQIHFPFGETIISRGCAEWIRDINPVLQDSYPGAGIRLKNLSIREKKIINEYLLEHPPVFLEGNDIEFALSSDSSTDNIVFEKIPPGVGPDCDIRKEQLFVAGIIKDIQNYLEKNFYSKQVSKKHSKPTGAKPTGAGTNYLVKIIPYTKESSFQGNFVQEDGPYRLFAQTTKPLEMNETIPLEIIGEYGKRVTCKAIVRWVRKFNPVVNNPLFPPGIGLALCNLDESSWNFLGGKKDSMLMGKAID